MPDSFQTHEQPAQSLLSLPFDHYQRYSLTQRFVTLLRSEGSTFRVLDVGGHGSSLKHFLPNDEVILSDILAPPDFGHVADIPFLHDGYIRAVGQSLPFGDTSFDIVTAHDTLEHVPEEHRRLFLLELLRVSRRLVILNGPLRTPDTIWAEERIRTFAERALDWQNPYLQEHLAAGLPPRERIEEVLRERKVSFFSVPNGNIYLWLAMMAFKHYLQAFPDPGALPEAIERAYNTLISRMDFGSQCYREAYIIALDASDFPALDAARHSIAGLPGGVCSDIGIEALEPLLGALEAQAIRVRRDSGEARRAAELEAALEILKTALAEREEALAEQNATLAGGEAALREREEAIQALESQIAAMTGSAGYRLLDYYRRLMRRLFPPGSRRGVPYRLFIRGLRWNIRVKPWRKPGRALSLARRSVGRSGHLTRRSMAIIRREGWGPFIRKARTRLSMAVRQGSLGPLPVFPPVSYEEWIAHNEPGRQEIDRQRETASRLPYRPLISVIVPVWNPVPEHFRQTIESVKAQTYDNWELCIADASTREGVREALEKVRRDVRVKVKYLDENLGIAGNSNEALALAEGDFVAFLDHTDLLAPNALWEVAVQINRNPSLDCLYSDYDLVSEDGGRRFNPLFNPSWSPDMLLSANYTAHLNVMRRRLVEDLNGLRSETDGAQDWDLMLRLSEKTQRVGHIPKVLYHWRADATSAVLSLDSKPYALRAQERAVQEHLERLGWPARVTRNQRGAWQIKWQASGNTKVSIIIPTKHNRKLLNACLQSIARSTYKNWEVIVIETAGRNASREAWYRQIQKAAPLKVLWWEQPFNYSAVNNLGARESEGDALLFLNDDTEALNPAWLEEMVGWLERPGVGIVGAQLLAEDGRIQHGGDILGLRGFADHLFTGAAENEWTLLGSTGWYRNLLAVTGACLLTRRDLFEKVGGFDESFHLCGSDVEYCLRVRRAGYRTVCTPFARVLHHERATRGSLDVGEDAFTSYWHYQPYLNKGDPFFSPNLSAFSSIPRLKHPAEPHALAVVGPVIGRDVAPRTQPGQSLEEQAASFAESCQISDRDVQANHRLREANRAPFPIKSINWFIPDMESPFYGGIHTILRFADHFKRNYGVVSRFIILGSGPPPLVRAGVKAAFPALADADIQTCSLAEHDIQALPEADASVATLWVTAYALSKFQRTKRKFYMVQDFEPVFYPAGTIYAMCEATYRFGFYGLCNTQTLKEIYEKDYGGKAVGFTPCVDTSIFHPPEGARVENETPVVFLYGRPGHWRNCWELAMAALRRLKERMKKEVRVVTAGSWAAPSDSASSYLVEQLGLLAYKETADLYRTCDVGLALSVSKHPSYLPLELMACGALVVSNVNRAGSWLLHSGENCLLAEPTAESLSEALEKALTDRELRGRLTAQGLADIKERHSDWPREIDKVYRFMCDPEG